MRRNLFQFLLVAVLSVFATVSMAQTTVKGQLVDAETNEPLVAATVVVEGTSTGCVTDFDGYFTQEVANGATLVFKYVGYKELKKNGGMMSTGLARRFAKVYEDSARLDLFMGKVDYAIRFYLQAAGYCDKLPYEFRRLCEEALSIARKYRFEHVLKEEKCKAILQPYLQCNLTGGAA
jgi:hypothetical protein